MNNNIFSTSTTEADVVYKKIVKPLKLELSPKKDITALELAECLKYMFRTNIYPSEIKDNVIFRHFDIVDPNK